MTSYICGKNDVANIQLIEKAVRQHSGLPDVDANIARSIDALKSD